MSHDAQDTGRTVVGLFPSRSDAESAIRELKDVGFSDERIGVAMQEPGERQDALEATGTNAAEGAAAGALSGGLGGGLIGLLGSLLIPGLGPIVVGGLLASTLTGAGVGAATGGIIGALMGMGVPPADAEHFDQGIRSGRTLVTVDAGPRTDEALLILDRHGMDYGPSGRGRYAVAVPDAGIGSLENAALGGIGAGDVASTSPRQRYRGRDRRAGVDPEYDGPERRLVGV